MKLKVCGNKVNIEEVATLEPDYLGFIFWEPSARYFDGELAVLPKKIKKVGVFVDADFSNITDKIIKYDLELVQLHGTESPDYCSELFAQMKKTTGREIGIIKVFTIKDTFNFDRLKPYESVCDYYLFDTKGPLPGGNGYAFDWSILKDYPSSKPFFLSGGIGNESVEEIKAFMGTMVSELCEVIDVNSRFESEPGHKIIEELRRFRDFLDGEY
ncbi:phosphoribosylanthranilate isomerase [Poritiphilus flavus]|uniref:N-(5'-phosphoribosyl)anthranilate isomerase n=1 Tax=Poritiphilus flavus TaxID=2697053 RepID=A0A6L9EBK5_9FLAO|nr:phosphoribosylanthranilate isomerase [Poritiphilus flavus]NAS11789.1 phosphoribosylanthranilate isomerase [Poritiphilus flavus]